MLELEQFPELAPDQREAIADAHRAVDKLARTLVADLTQHAHAVDGLRTEVQRAEAANGALAEEVARLSHDLTGLFLVTKATFSATQRFARDGDDEAQLAAENYWRWRPCSRWVPPAPGDPVHAASGAVRAAHDVLHPNGACTCAGEGRCTCCKMAELAEENAKLEKERDEARAQVIERDDVIAILERAGRDHLAAGQREHDRANKAERERDEAVKVINVCAPALAGVWVVGCPQDAAARAIAKFRKLEAHPTSGPSSPAGAPGQVDSPTPAASSATASPSAAVESRSAGPERDPILDPRPRDVIIFDDGVAIEVLARTDDKVTWIASGYAASNTSTIERWRSWTGENRKTCGQHWGSAEGLLRCYEPRGHAGDCRPTPLRSGKITSAVRP